MVPSTSPKPTRKPSPWHQPRITSEVAVFEERALDAAVELDRLGAVPADLQQAAALVLLGAGDGAAAQEIADIHGAADEAWCTSCCTDDQYMYLKLVRQMVCGAFMPPARKATSSSMS